MTLVVAKRRGNQLYFVSDTGIVDPTRRSASAITSGVLKIVVPSPDICIAFSGSVDLAHAALQSAHDCRDLSNVREILLQKHMDSAGSIDFLVARLGSHNDLSYIKDFTCTSTQDGWIGDIEAFERYQFYFNTLKKPTGLMPSALFESLQIPIGADVDAEFWCRMVTALEEVLLDKRASTARGIAVPVASEGGRFKFINRMRSLSQVDLSTILESGGGPIPFGTAHDGSCTFEFAETTSQDGIGASLYFLQPHLGVLFRRKKSLLLEPHLVRNADPLNFLELSLANFGVKARCGFLQPEHYCNRALRRFNDGDKQGAQEDLEQALALGPTNPAAKQCAGRIHLKNGEFTCAIERLTESIAIDGQNGTSFGLRGIAHASLGQLYESLGDLTKAIEYSSEEPAWYEARAAVHEVMGDLRAGLTDRKTAAQLRQ